MIYVISDLHLGVGDSNEFDAEKDLTAFLKGIPDRSLVINGDLFELLKDDPLEAIVKRWKGLVDLLFQKALVYLAGNHDRFMLCSSFTPPMFMGVPVARQVIIGDTLIMHGDFFDVANCGLTESHAIGDSITQAVGWLAENITTEVNEWSRELEKAVRNIGRNGDPQYYSTSALNYIEHIIIDWHRLSKVVLGHTHQKDHGIRNDRFEYFNSGCWLLGHEDILTIDERGTV